MKPEEQSLKGKVLISWKSKCTGLVFKIVLSGGISYKMMQKNAWWDEFIKLSKGFFGQTFQLHLVIRKSLKSNQALSALYSLDYQSGSDQIDSNFNFIGCNSEYNNRMKINEA